MIGNIDIKSSVLGALIGAMVIFSLGAATGNGRRAAWDYKLIPDKVFQEELEKKINIAVSDGWEFVEVSDFSTEQWAFAVMRLEKRRSQ
jgi:hypothetical protein